MAPVISVTTDVAMLVNVDASLVSVAVAVLAGGVTVTVGVVKVDVVETMMYVEVTPHWYSERYPAAP